MRIQYNPDATLMVEGDSVTYRSRLEADLANEMKRFGIEYVYEERQYELSDNTLYIPDFSWPKEFPFVDDASALKVKDIVEAYIAKGGSRWDFTWIEVKPKDVLNDLMDAFGITRRFGPYLQGAPEGDLEVSLEFKAEGFNQLRITDKRSKELIKPKLLAEDTGSNVLVVFDSTTQAFKLSVMLTKDEIVFMREHPIPNLAMWQKRIEKARKEEIEERERTKAKAERAHAKELAKRQICNEVREVLKYSQRMVANLYRQKCVFCDAYVEAREGYGIYSDEWYAMHKGCIES